MTDKFTIENLFDYPVGTKVELFWGAYYAPAYGKVVGHEILPETKYMPLTARLVIEYEDHEGEMHKTTCIGFTEKGIGVRLIELADKPKNKKSPWAA